MKNEQFSGIWIFAEHENGAVKPVVFELLAKAQELKAHNGENITAVLLGANVAGLAPELIARGADEVIVAEDEALAEYSARPLPAGSQPACEEVQALDPALRSNGAWP